ncbi:hypothetical protein D3C85_1061130 [compost metagenome]
MVLFKFGLLLSAAVLSPVMRLSSGEIFCCLHPTESAIPNSNALRKFKDFRFIMVLGLIRLVIVLVVLISYLQV